MKVVALSYAYPPQRTPQAVQLARLVHHSATPIHVICGADDEAALEGELLDAYPDALGRVARVPWSRRARGLRRASDRVLRQGMQVPDRWRPWQREAVRRIRGAQLLDRGDVLVTFAMPMSNHLPGLRLAHSGVRWIAHFSDPFVDSPFRHDRRVAAALNARLEARVVTRADRLVFTCAEAADLVMAKYDKRHRERVHVLPHAYDRRLFPSADPPRDAVVVRFLGNFYGRRGPEPLFDALRIVHRRRPELLAGVRVELVGGHQHPVDAAANRLPQGLLRLLPPVPYLESLALMRTSHLLLVIDAPADRSVFLPSKLVEYLGARRPILALTPEGPAADVVRRAGGWQAHPGDAEAGARALEAALARIRDGAAAVDAAFAECYDAAAVAARFDGLVREVAAR